MKPHINLFQTMPQSWPTSPECYKASCLHRNSRRTSERNSFCAFVVFLCFFENNERDFFFFCFIQYNITESLKKIYLDKSKLHEKLKTLLIEVRNMKIVFKNFTILFHRRLNSVSKLANQSLIDLKIATLKSIKVLKTKTMPISKYRNCLLTIRTYIKNFKNELHNANILFKDKKYELRKCTTIKKFGKKVQDLSIFINSIDELSKLTEKEIWPLKVPKINQKFQKIYTRLNDTIYNLKLLLTSADKKIDQFESEKFQLKEQFGKLIVSKDSDWDLCDSKELVDNFSKDNIIKMLKEYFHFK